jgi:hypothetical protein
MLGLNKYREKILRTAAKLSMLNIIKLHKILLLQIFYVSPTQFVTSDTIKNLMTNLMIILSMVINALHNILEIASMNEKFQFIA